MLAERLGWGFVDVDDAIRARFDGHTVASIWATEGEPAYRAVEVDVTCELCAQDHQVIALGGGTLMEDGARRAVEQADAFRVYLHAPIEVLAARMAGDAQTAEHRPSLTGGNALDEVTQVMQVRGPVYEAVADLLIDVSEAGPEAVVASVLDAMPPG